MTAPETIYLQHDPENISGEEFPTKDLWEHVTWSSGPVFETDIKYTRSDLCIRRDDPALRRVEDALEHALYLLPRNCNQRVSMEAALAAMQELIGGKDEKTP